jgi:hypothetical protein
MKRVVIDIESLVLKGFRYEDRHAIAAALQHELAATIAGPEAAERLASLGSAAHLRLGSVNLGASADAHEVGAQTGRAVGAGLIK